MYDFNEACQRATTKAEKYRLRKELFGTDDVLPMWVADMDLKTLQFVVDAVTQRASEGTYGYEMYDEEAKLAQIAWMKKRHNFEFKVEDLFYSHSVVASMNVAIQAFSEVGDKVIVQTPVYSPFFKSVKNNNRELLLNPLKKDDNGDYTFDFDALESKVDEKTKLLLLCSPHNPVGRVWTKQELERLSKICIKHNIVVFSDEIHSDLLIAGAKHTPFATLSAEASALCITAIGVGKTFNLAGIASSNVVIQNETLKKRFDEVYESIHFAQGNVFAHVAITAAYSKGEQWIDELLVHLENNFKRLSDMLLEFDNVISFHIPQGTYLAWLDCSKLGLRDRELRDFFVNEARLGLSPGLSFGKEGSQYMRINCAVSTDMMVEAVERLASALEGRKYGKN